MKFETLLTATLSRSGAYQQLQAAVEAGKLPALVTGIPEGMKALMALLLSEQSGRPVLIVTSSEEAALRRAQDLSALTGEEVPGFAARPLTLFRSDALGQDVTRRRLSVLGRALSGRAVVQPTSIDALMAPQADPEDFRRACVVLHRGDMRDRDDLAQKLVWAGYRREERAEAPGQIAIRGGLLDIYPMAGMDPVRVEFFGDEIDTLRSFDPVTQRSVSALDEALILPAQEMPLTQVRMERGIEMILNEARKLSEKLKKKKNREQPGFSLARLTQEDPQQRVLQMAESFRDDLLSLGRFAGMEAYAAAFYDKRYTLADYFKDPILLLDEPVRLKERCANLALEYQQTYADALESGRTLPVTSDLVQDFEGFVHRLGLSRSVVFQTILTGDGIAPRELIRMNGMDTASFRGQFELLRGDVQRWRQEGWKVVLMAGGARRGEHLSESLREYHMTVPCLTQDREAEPGEAVIVPFSTVQGFQCPEEKLVFVSERELFGAARTQGQRRKARQVKSLDLFSDLAPGDYVVHEVHGIGRFQGIAKLDADGSSRDYLKILYRDEDVLYVPAEQMDRVQKYIGNADAPPRMNRLGGSEFKRAKAKAKGAIVDIADDLLKLYAQREAARGYAFSPDSVWQREMEGNFPYEETPDQLQSIEEIKADMESARVMDRLLCGDVGYGKTEVALRAVFKAVMDHKQVAFLAPTTILTVQHAHTLRKRFEGFPVRVETLNRFRTPAEVKSILSGLASGEVDVVIGTHKLLGKDVRFRDLGLLVVDEEQRFGVAHKEKIKQLRAAVDVLTLSATPIPRTLHMSMVGIRDISVINTPPEERYPVQTVVAEYDEGLIRDAIVRELGRGGQVYFVYNRVEFIQSMASQLSALVPEAKIAVGHGQMPEHQLERVMADFMEGEYDILLCSTIIESGLDIPNVNTMIVYDSDHFGLSQLYQLRGRVGRSNRLAYCYLTYRRDRVLSETAEKRLSTLRNFTEFGSGFKVAMRDLELRGAGNLLGTEQSGHMSALGYGMYCKLIEETVAEMKGEESLTARDPVLEIRVEAFLPESYVPGAEDRLDVYCRIAAIRSDTERMDMTDELIDRFGDPPPEVEQLLNVSILRAYCMACGIEGVKQTGCTAILRFSPYAAVDPLQVMKLLDLFPGQLRLHNSQPPRVQLRLREEEEKQMLDKLLLLTGTLSGKISPTA